MGEIKGLSVSTQHVILCSTYSMPCNVDIYEQALKDNPEYFKEELEYRRKWEAIPKSIKNKYYKELGEFETNIYGKAPHAGKGLIFFANNPQASYEYSKYIASYRDELESKRKELNDKYFKKYGL